MWARARKALVAGFWGGVSAAESGFVFTGAPTRDQVGALFGLFVGGAVLTFSATYRAKPNAASSARDA